MRLSGSKADTLSIWYKNCRMRRDTLENNWDNKHVVSCCLFLKIRSYRSRLVFNCCFKDIDISQGSDRSVATHLRFGGIYSDSVIYKCSPGSDSEINLKIGEDLMRLWHMKLRRTKKCASFFGPPCIVVRKIWPGPTQLSRYIVSRRHGPTFHKTRAREQFN